MDARAFFYLVKQMRQAQREYFAHRDGWTLRRARALEGDVDREILRVTDIIAAREQTAEPPNPDTSPPPHPDTSPPPLVVTMVPPSRRE